jgi:hypothetical protein
MANKAAIKRGWHWDEANGYLEAYVNGTQMLSLDDTNSRVQIGTKSAYLDFRIYMGSASKYILFDNSIAYLYLEDTDIKMGDNDIIMFGDGSGGDVRMKWNGSVFQILPLTDDTGYVAIGNGTTDMDFVVFGGSKTKYMLLDNSIAYLYLEDVDLKLGDNDVLMFGDGSGGDVRMKWNASLLQMLPLANDTGYFAIGNGTTDMDFKVYLGNPGYYVLADVGNAYLSIVNGQLYVPNMGSTGTTAGLLYKNSNNYVCISA